MADNDQAQTDATAEENAQDFKDAFKERAKDPFGTADKPETVADQATKTDEATNEVAKVEAPSQEAATDTSGAPQKAFDPWEGLSSEQRSHFERMQASDRSNRGRVGALTKKLNSLTHQTQQPLEKKGEEAEGGNDKAASADDIEARLDQVATDYSDVNGPVVEEIKRLRQEIGSLKASANRNEVEADAEKLTEAYEALEEKHSDFVDFAPPGDDGTPPGKQFEAFAGWLVEQPDNIKLLANSFDPKEVSLALTLFKTESGLVTEQPGDRGGEGKGSTATEDKRQRQLSGNRDAKPKGGAPAATGVPNEFGSAFKARASQIEQERTATR